MKLNPVCIVMTLISTEIYAGNGNFSDGVNFTKEEFIDIFNIGLINAPREESFEGARMFLNKGIDLN